MYRIVLVRIMGNGERIRLKEVGFTENHGEAQKIGQAEVRIAESRDGGEFSYDVDKSV